MTFLSDEQLEEVKEPAMRLLRLAAETDGGGWLQTTVDALKYLFDTSGLNADVSTAQGTSTECALRLKDKGQP